MAHVEKFAFGIPYSSVQLFSNSSQNRNSHGQRFKNKGAVLRRVVYVSAAKGKGSSRSDDNRSQRERIMGAQLKISESDYKKLGQLLGDSRAEIQDKVAEVKDTQSRAARALGTEVPEAESSVLPTEDELDDRSYARLDALLGRGEVKPLSMPKRNLQVSRRPGGKAGGGGVGGQPTASRPRPPSKASSAAASPAPSLTRRPTKPGEMPKDIPQVSQTKPTYADLQKLLDKGVGGGGGGKVKPQAESPVLKVPGRIKAKQQKQAQDLAAAATSWSDTLKESQKTRQVNTGGLKKPERKAPEVDDLLKSKPSPSSAQAPSAPVQEKAVWKGEKKKTSAAVEPPVESWSDTLKASQQTREVKVDGLKKPERKPVVEEVATPTPAAPVKTTPPPKAKKAVSVKKSVTPKSPARKPEKEAKVETVKVEEEKEKKIEAAVKSETKEEVKEVVEVVEEVEPVLEPLVERPTPPATPQVPLAELAKSRPQRPPPPPPPPPPSPKPSSSATVAPKRNTSKPVPGRESMVTSVINTGNATDNTEEGKSPLEEESKEEKVVEETPKPSAPTVASAVEEQEEEQVKENETPLESLDGVRRPPSRPVRPTTLRDSTSPPRDPQDTARLQRNLEAAMAQAMELMESGEWTSAVIIGHNNGGLLAKVKDGNLRGFIPFSQIGQGLRTLLASMKAKDRAMQRQGEKISEEKSSESEESKASEEEKGNENEKSEEYEDQAHKRLVGGEVLVKILSVDTTRYRSVMTADVSSSYLRKEESMKAVKRALLQTLSVGDQVEATVTNFADFGVFCLVQGVDALIHISELGYGRVKHPSDTGLKIGEKVKAEVTAIDPQALRLALSLKRLQADPLLQTLDQLVAAAESGDVEVEEGNIPEVERVCQTLAAQEHIDAIAPGQRFRSSSVSKDFQLWLSSATADGFKLLARKGYSMQEIQVQTTLARADLRASIGNAMDIVTSELDEIEANDVY